MTALEKLVKEKLIEGSEVSANSMRPLATAARNTSSRPTLTIRKKLIRFL